MPEKLALLLKLEKFDKSPDKEQLISTKMAQGKMIYKMGIRAVCSCHIKCKYVIKC